MRDEGHCLGCARVSTHPVTLIDGTTVCNECPSWRMECEARDVAGMDKADRDSYMRDVAHRRGREAAMELWNLAKRVK